MMLSRSVSTNYYRVPCIKSNVSERNSKMRSWIIVLFTALTVCDSRPNANGGVHVTPVKGVGAYIVGGTDASPGEFPWQLVMTSGFTGALMCGGTLLDSNYGLTAATCVDGTPASSMQVIAGLYNRNDLSGTQTVDISSYTMHPSYGVGSVSYANDIAILNFAAPVTIGGNIQAAVLPENNNGFVGVVCDITGWGQTDGPNNPPTILQKASVQVISTVQCSNALAGIGSIWDNQICVEDPVGNAAACHGDEGGPLNCPDGGVTLVVGVGSWVVSGSSGCRGLPSYPSVYTRVSSYLGWIGDNTP